MVRLCGVRLAQHGVLRVIVRSHVMHWVSVMHCAFRPGGESKRRRIASAPRRLEPVSGKCPWGADFFLLVIHNARMTYRGFKRGD
jgi:hypothetical protein